MGMLKRLFRRKICRMMIACARALASMGFDTRDLRKAIVNLKKTGEVEN